MLACSRSRKKRPENADLDEGRAGFMHLALTPAFSMAIAMGGSEREENAGEKEVERGRLSFGVVLVIVGPFYSKS